MQCPYIIIFDSHCSFCNASVNFLIKRDPKKLFCFASMHSSVAHSLIQEQGLDEPDSDTIILIKEDRSYLRAEAVYEILKAMGGVWSFLRIFKVLGFSYNDSLYRYIAKNRHRIFTGRSCLLPSEEFRSRFFGDKN
jgi:predicted DCC family thiol-disulfide oxidoreductase YuxK